MSETRQFNELLARDKRYQRGAYVLVSEALEYAVEKRRKSRSRHGDSCRDEGPTHISGQDLCLAVKEYALRKYGMMAAMVLGSMGVSKTDDIGAIVFNLIEIGLMSKSGDDSPEDFIDLFDLSQELDEGFAFRKQ